jgi:oligogalacturonide transporter
MALFVYFLNYYLGRPELYPVAMGSLLVTQLAAMPVYVRISNRRGKGRAYVLGLAIAVVGLMAAWFLEPGTPVPVIAAVCALIGFGQAAGVMIPWAILPSVTDVDELITGKQRAGTYAGAMTLFRKFVQGVIALPLVGLALEVLGFGEGTAAGADIESLKLVFMFGPASLLILGILVASQFRITPHTHRLLRQEIDRLAGGGAKSAVTEETRRTCERMTGINYDELYRA